MAAAKVFAAALAGLLISLPAQAGDGPSFSCTANLTQTEKTICADPSLAALDTVLAAAYAKKRDSLPEDSGNPLDDVRHAIVVTQKAWIAHRNQCGTDTACIRKVYLVRTGALTAGDNVPDVSCRDTIGAAQADLFVRECLQVATETHPPCNADNTCELIVSHSIFRCSTLGNQAPRFCASFGKPN